MFISPNGGSCEKSLDSDVISKGSEIFCPAAKHSPMRSFSKSGSVVEVVDCLEEGGLVVVVYKIFRVNSL